MPEILVGAKSVCCCCLRCPEELLDMTTGEPSPFDMMSSCFGYVNVQPSTGVLLICSKCNHHLVQSWEFIYKIRATQRLLRTLSCHVNVGMKIDTETRDPPFKELKLIPIAKISHTPTEFRTVVAQSEATSFIDEMEEINTEIEIDYESVKLEPEEVSQDYQCEKLIFKTEPADSQNELTEDNTLSTKRIPKKKCLARKKHPQKRSEKNSHKLTNSRPNQGVKSTVESKENGMVFKKLMTLYSYNKHVKVSSGNADTAATVDKEIYIFDPGESTCKICSKTFRWSRQLCEHLAVHFPRYVCQVCGKHFAFSSSLRSHLKSHDDSIFRCDICDKSYTWRINLIKHIKTHANGRGNLVKCNQCPKTFATFYSKIKHLSEVHGDRSKLRNCHYCSKSFYTVGNMNQHISRNHVKVMKNVCPVCGKGFLTSGQLESHKYTHSDVRAFACQVCNKTYKYKKTLSEHMKIHTGDKRFQCDVCERRFTQKCFLAGHMKKHQRDTHKVPKNKYKNQSYY